MDRRRRGAVVDRMNQAIAASPTLVTAGQQSQETSRDNKQQSTMHSFPTFPV